MSPSVNQKNCRRIFLTWAALFVSFLLKTSSAFTSVGTPLDAPDHLWNAIIDWLIGLIPLLGDVFDIGWKANLRNVALLKEHLKRRDTDAPIDITPTGTKSQDSKV